MSLSVNNNPQTVDPNLVGAAMDRLAAGQSEIEARVADRVSQIAALLSGRSVNVDGTVGTKSNVGDKRVLEIPDLDEADFMDEAALVSLVAYLRTSSLLQQARTAQAVIKNQLAKAEGEKELTLKKINEAVDKAVEQTKKEKRNKILGWFLCALAVVAAVVTTVATAGAASPGAFAIVACVASCVGAAMSLTTNILDATSATEKAIRDKAERYMKDDPNLSETEAKNRAQKNWAIAWGVASAVVAVTGLVGGIGSAVNAFKTAKAVKEALNILKTCKDVESAVYQTALATVQAAKNTVSVAMQITQYILQGLSFIGNGISQGFGIELLLLSRDAAKASAKAKMLQAMLEMINKRIEDLEELLQSLMQQLSDLFNVIFDILDAGNRNSNEILMNSQPAV